MGYSWGIVLVNQTEAAGYHYLQTMLQIDKRDITFRGHTSPDFIVQDGRAYEIKKGYLDKSGKIHVVFKGKQLEEMQKSNPETVILIFFDKTKPPIEIPVQNINRNTKKVGDVSIHWSNQVTITVSEKLYDHLKMAADMEGRTIQGLIERKFYGLREVIEEPFATRAEVKDMIDKAIAETAREMADDFQYVKLPKMQEAVLAALENYLKGEKIRRD